MKRIIQAVRQGTGWFVLAAACLAASHQAQAQNLFVSSYSSSGTVYEIAPDGQQSVFTSGVSYSLGLAFNSAGNLFVGNQDAGAIYEYSSGGSRSEFATGLNGPTAMAFNSSGVMFEVDEDSGRVYEISSTGHLSTFASGLDYPDGLAFNRAGDLFVSDWGSGNIYEFTPNGTRTTFASGLSPDGLAFDGAGDLFDADITSGNIYEFPNINGTLSSTPVVFPATGLYRPSSLAFNNAGDLFVSSFGNGDILEFTPNGTESTFASGLDSPLVLAFQDVALPVPEPATAGLLAAGTAMLFIFSNRKTSGRRSAG